MSLLQIIWPWLLVILAIAGVAGLPLLTALLRPARRRLDEGRQTDVRRMDVTCRLDADSL